MLGIIQTHPPEQESFASGLDGALAWDWPLFCYDAGAASIGLCPASLELMAPEAIGDRKAIVLGAEPLCCLLHQAYKSV